MDTGANRTTFTRASIDQYPDLVTQHLPRGQHTRSFVYGNGTEFKSEDAVKLGDYTAHIVPTEHQVNLVSINEICVKGGHVALFTPNSVVVHDIGNSYEIRYPKLLSEDDWLVPPDILNILSDLRDKHPLCPTLWTSLASKPIGFEHIKALQSETAEPSTNAITTKSRRNRMFSGRLHNSDPALRPKVFHCHYRFGHVCEDSMAHALTPQGPDNLPYWRNLDIKPEDVRRVFRHEPCLLCVLAKRRKEGKRQLKTSKSAEPKPPELDPKSPELDRKLRLLAEPKAEPTEAEEEQYKRQLEDDSKLRPGEILSVDEVPVSPVSIDGYNTFFIFRDTKTRTLFSFTTKDKNEDTYLACLKHVLIYFKRLYEKHSDWGSMPVITVRSDYMKTYKSRKVLNFYQENNCKCELSSPYQHWQVAVERDIQTVINSMAAVIHTNHFINASAWSYALRHFTCVFNDTPLSSTGYRSPNQLCNPSHFVDASVKYRYAFSDLLVFPLQDGERKWKFDVRNEVGFYFGDDTLTKDAVYIYLPFHHQLVSRAGAERVDVSELQLLRWYGKRVDVRKPTLTFGEVRKGMLELAPEIFEDEEPTMRNAKITEGSDDEQYSSDESVSDDNTNDSGAALDQHTLRMEPQSRVNKKLSSKRGRGKRNKQRASDRIILPVETLPLEPLQTRGQKGVGKHVDYRSMINSSVDLEYRGRRTIPGAKASYHRPSESLDYSDALELEETMSKMNVDDNHSAELFETIISHIYRSMELSDPEHNFDFVDGEEYIDSIEAPEAIRIDQKSGTNLFQEAIRAEVLENLLKNTNTLKAISEAEVRSMSTVIYIPTTVKCKRKLKPDGAYDKHKARMAARGDLLVRKMLKLGMDLPDTFSPTIRTLTFLLVLQIAVAKGLKCATQDIKYAYLNVDIPEGDIPIITKLHPLVAQICGLDPNQSYRIMKCLYGLPKSGKLWYEHYRNSLIKEGYMQSKSDPCLFYRVNDEEATYVCLFVDDTFVFSNSEANLDKFLKSMEKYYQVSLDTTAESFLGVHFNHLNDGSVLMTQPKLIQKVLKEYPKIERYVSKKHPYGPPPLTGHEDRYAQSPPCEQRKYLRLLGILLYLTKSRPDIMTAVSFGATKAHSPKDMDYRKLLYIVEYLRITLDKGHRIYRNEGQPVQLHCTVDASYLLHSDSKGHTGYTIGFYNEGTFYNRSAKQSLVSTSSTHAEMRAIFTLVKDIIYVLSVCLELSINLIMPAIIMEDNSAVITVTTDESAYMKKCKHFLMLINYVREQVDLGIIKIFKIPGTQNMSDVLTKPNFNEKDFETKTDSILGKRPSND